MDEPRTFKIISMADFDHDADIAEQAALFPGSRYGDPRTLKRGLMREFEGALAVGSEEAIQQLLTENPYLLQYITPNSGHHGTWVFPKQTIGVHAPDGTRGLIPDFLVVARNSLGFKWHIVELKRATVQFSNAKGDGYSGDGNKGIAQCLKYRAHFTDYVDAVRSFIRVPDLIVPESVILLIGDSLHETEAQRKCRAEFDRGTSDMSIASYDRIRRGLANDQRDHAETEAEWRQRTGIK
jgi:hypothetical protein